MAAFWRLYSHWRKVRYSNIQNSYVVYLYFFSYNGVAADRLYDHGFLDEHQKIYSVCKTKPFEIPVSLCLNWNTTILTTTNS